MRTPAALLTLLLAAGLIGTMLHVFVAEERALETTSIRDYSGREQSCFIQDLTVFDSQINIGDGNCLQVNLGTRLPGSVLSFDFDFGGVPIDVLFFDGNGLSTYLNNQSYRDHMERDPSLELMSEDVHFHWQIPGDLSERNWYIIIDNFAHPGDDGEGGQGGGMATIQGIVEEVEDGQWVLVNGIQRLSEGQFRQLTGTGGLKLDSSSILEVQVMPIEGAVDLLVMDSSQREDYLGGTGTTWWVEGGRMLNVNSTETLSFTTPPSLAGKPLHIYLDNKEGPSGGADGWPIVRATVVITINPILNPQISAEHAGGTVDVGELVTLSANSTPNMNQQVNTLSWDLDSTIDSDGNSDPTDDNDATGWWNHVTWDEPGTRLVTLTITGIDSSTEVATWQVEVVDETPPMAKILSSNELERGLGESLTLISTSTDNHQIAEHRWMVDGIVEGTDASFTRSWSTLGDKHVELIVIDDADLEDNLTIVVHVVDVTPPTGLHITAVNGLQQGKMATFSGAATDPDSSSLTYHWDFESATDTDEDGTPNNDQQATGEQVNFAYDKEGVFTITLTVTNAAGLSSQTTSVVTVSAPGGSTGALGDSSFSKVLPLIILIGLLIGGFITWNKYQDRKTLQEMMVQNASTQIDQSAQAEVGHEDQLAMFKPSGSTFANPRASAEAEIAAMAGADSAVSTGGGMMIGGRASADAEMAALAGLPAPTQTQAPAQATFDDFGEDLVEKEDEFAFLNEEPTPKPKQQPQPKPKPQPEPKPAPQSLPETSRPSVSSPAFDPYGGVEESKPQQAAPEIMQGACADCGQPFAVELPVGVKEAVVVCPKCSLKQLFQR